MTSATTLTVRSDRTFFLFNALLSAVAVSFIAFILLRDSRSTDTSALAFMPAVNAICNTLAALCLIGGYVAIRRGSMRVHRALMVSAFAMSALFLVGYLTYHYVHGDTRYAGEGLGRVIYLVILASHILLSLTVVPGALTSFYFAYVKRFDSHRRLNRVFFPIWLYVSVTGVLIYFLLRA